MRAIASSAASIRLFTVPGLDLATRMVLELCGGEASEAAVAGEVPQDNRVIDFPWSEVPRLSGLDVSAGRNPKGSWRSSVSDRRAPATA